jgi:coenzyme F420-reducing hydrogenase beta subunit
MDQWKKQQLLLFPIDKEKVIDKAMNKFKLPVYAKGKIKKILEEQASTHRCCHSGCEVCFLDLEKCLEYIRLRV